MKVLLICSSGMSSSVLVSNMQKYAAEENIPLEIEALGRDESSQIALKYDLILLAPQVRYQKERFLKATNHSIPIDVIEPTSYGTLNGEKVVKQALYVLEHNESYL